MSNKREDSYKSKYALAQENFYAKQQARQKEQQRAAHLKQVQQQKLACLREQQQVQQVQQQVEQQQRAAAQQQQQVQQQRVQEQQEVQQQQAQVVSAQQNQQLLQQQRQLQQEQLRQQQLRQQQLQQQQLQQQQLQQQQQATIQQQQQLSQAGVRQQNQQQAQQLQQQKSKQQLQQQQRQNQQQQRLQQLSAKQRQNQRQRQQGVRQKYSERSRYVSERSSHRHSRRIIVIIAALILIALIVIASFILSGNSNNSSFSNDGISGAVNSATKDRSLPTPIMSEADGVQMHCAVAMEDLTELLFHNASYTYAYGMTTQLSEATNADVMAKHGTGRRASTQPTGNAWMTGEFIRTFRSESAGPQMSAIDCGGAVGTKVYAPVSGEVVLVKEYQLYGQYPDIQIHIRPEGRSDLDCVLIHLQNAKVKQGDKVVAGESELAEIRDVYAYIGDSMQLKYYTAENDNGNHTHIQMNNVNDPNYHGLDDIK